MIRILIRVIYGARHWLVLTAGLSEMVIAQQAIRTWTEQSLCNEDLSEIPFQKPFGPLPNGPQDTTLCRPTGTFEYQFKHAYCILDGI